MTSQKNAAELIQSMLNEQHGKGFHEGYQEALGDVLDFIKAKLTPTGQVERVTGSFLADHPGNENDAEMPEPAPPVVVQPHLKKALEYLKQHPGTTAHEARGVVRNRNAFRTLAQLGLAEKRGSQFFPQAAE